MRVIIEKNYDELARWAARHSYWVCQQVHHLLVCMQKS